MFVDLNTFTDGRKHTRSIKNKACLLRQRGRTHREIERAIGVCKSLVAVWTKDVVLTTRQRAEIYRRRSGLTPRGRKRLQHEAKTRLVQFHFSKKYNTEALLDRIRNFYRVNGRIPLKHEFNTYRIYAKSFGSWNKAKRCAGFTPHKNLFAKRFTAKDGHICDSYTEMIIDNCFFDHSIPHELHIRYPNSRLRTDFYIDGKYVEFFGLAGELQSYDILRERKRELCVKQKLPLIEIYPYDIYKKNGLLNIAEKFIDTVPFSQKK